MLCRLTSSPSDSPSLSVSALSGSVSPEPAVPVPPPAAYYADTALGRLAGPLLLLQSVLLVGSVAGGTIARRRRVRVNVYLEDWSSGVRESFDYVFAMVQHLRSLRVARIYLADTLGVLAPEDVTRYVGLMTATWPEVDFEFHSHNDYALATANCLAAVGLADALGIPMEAILAALRATTHAANPGRGNQLAAGARRLGGATCAHDGRRLPALGDGAEQR